MLLRASSAFCADYYLSPSGSDLNSGSISRPWKTLLHGGSNLHAGDTLWLGDGVYAGGVKLRFAGSSAKRVLIAAGQLQGDFTVTSAGVMTQTYVAVNITGTNLKQLVTIDP